MLLLFLSRSLPFCYSLVLPFLFQVFLFIWPLFNICKKVFNIYFVTCENLSMFSWTKIASFSFTDYYNSFLHISHINELFLIFLHFLWLFIASVYLYNLGCSGTSLLIRLTSNRKISRISLWLQRAGIKAMCRHFLLLI